MATSGMIVCVIKKLSEIADRNARIAMSAVWKPHFLRSEFVSVIISHKAITNSDVIKIPK